MTPCANAVKPDVGRNETDIDSNRANAHAGNAEIERAEKQCGRSIEGHYYICAGCYVLASCYALAVALCHIVAARVIW